jgi:hypothetical protein
MKYKINNFSVIPVFCAVLALSGCGAIDSVASLFDGSRSAAKNSHIIVVDSTPESIAHYALGRDYAASGRYELAKEQYALALAAANNPEMQQSLVMELDNVDMMIKSLR